MAHATLPLSQLVPTHHGASCRECPPVQPALMSVEMALDIWKWSFPWTCPTSSRWLGNDLQEPVGNKGRRHFQMFGTPTPKGAASTGRRRPTRAVETPERSRVPKQTVVGTCPGLTDVASERNRSIVRTWRNTSIKDTANCAQRVGRPPQVQSTAHPDVRHDDRRWSSRWRSLSRVQRQESAPAAILLL
jgi:hypothetical protein